MEGQPRDGEDEADQRQDERHPPVALQLALAATLVRLKAGVFPAIEKGSWVKDLVKSALCIESWLDQASNLINFH